MTADHSISRWVVAASVALTLLTGGAAQAAGTLRTVPAQLDKADANKYGEGKRAYDKQDYATAAKAFGGLMGRVPESPANRTIRASLVLDTMAAYQAAYETSGDIAMLRAGMDAYYNYFKAYRAAHGSTNIPESVVEARFVMKEALAHAEVRPHDGKPSGGEPSGGEPSGGEPSGGAPSDGTPSAGQPSDGKPAGTTANDSSARGGSTDDLSNPGTTMIATGAVLLALGVGSTAMIGIGAVEGKRAREDQKLEGYSPEQRDGIDRRGRSMNTLLIAGAVTAPVLAITGISLIAVGASSKRKAQLAVAPSVSRRFAGVVLRGRF